MCKYKCRIFELYIGLTVNDCNNFNYNNFIHSHLYVNVTLYLSRKTVFRLRACDINAKLMSIDYPYKILLQPLKIVVIAIKSTRTPKIFPHCRLFSVCRSLLLQKIKNFNKNFQSVGTNVQCVLYKFRSIKYYINCE